MSSARTADLTGTASTSAACGAPFTTVNRSHPSEPNPADQQRSTENDGRGSSCGPARPLRTGAGLHRLVDEVEDVPVRILEPHCLEVSHQVHVAVTRSARQVVV